MKKRYLLNLFYSSLEKLNYPQRQEIKNILEAIYKRDFFWNFRDLAKHNPYIKPNVLYRTSTLTSYQHEDLLMPFLKEKGISTIIDLRALHEIEKNPYDNSFIKNFKYVKAPFDPWNQPDWFKRTENYGTNSEIAYRFFVMACKTEVKKVFETIVDSKGAIIFHCLAGKDRTGFIAMLIHMLMKLHMNI
jgi:protein tyrosine/serine phosphatase